MGNSRAYANGKQFVAATTTEINRHGGGVRGFFGMLHEGLQPGTPARNLLMAATAATALDAAAGRLEGGTPANARSTLEYVRENGTAPQGYKGGGTFANDGRGGGQVLPTEDASGNPVTHKEWDVNPYQQGVDRGGQRLVTGSDGSAYYTDNHYKTFTQVPE